MLKATRAAMIEDAREMGTEVWVIIGSNIALTIALQDPRVAPLTMNLIRLISGILSGTV